MAIEKMKSSVPVYRPSSPYLVLLFIALLLLHKFNMEERGKRTGSMAVEMPGDTTAGVSIVEKNEKPGIKTVISDFFSDSQTVID